VRVTRAGICATDLEMLHGYHPFTGVLGHEFLPASWRAPEPGGTGAAWPARSTSAAASDDTAHGPEHCARRSALGIRGRWRVAGYVALPL
jgi:hypothetical protein